MSVQDTGPGLQDGTQELVFEPFYTRKPAGLGMGLSIVRLIIEAHGGVIGVTNNPTCGATFSFTLPRAGGGSGESECSAGYRVETYQGGTVTLRYSQLL